jgi:hypothetical protein
MGINQAFGCANLVESRAKKWDESQLGLSRPIQRASFALTCGPIEPLSGSQRSSKKSVVIDDAGRFLKVFEGRTGLKIAVQNK